MLLMSAGQAIAYADMSRSLNSTLTDQSQIDDIRAVWLAISIMLAGFGLTVIRATRKNVEADAFTLGIIGLVLGAFGVAGMAISNGSGFWTQHILLGLAMIFIALRTHRRSILATRTAREMNSPVAR